MNDDKLDKVIEKDYEKAIKEVLLAKSKTKYENRTPTKEELNMKWKLVKD